MKRCSYDNIMQCVHMFKRENAICQYYWTSYFYRYYNINNNNNLFTEIIPITIK